MKNENEKVFLFYKRLISLYPQTFTERFGESMEQTFNDVCNERNGEISLGLMVSIFAETSVGIMRENLHEFKRANQMDYWINTIGLAAIFSGLFSAAFFWIGTFYLDNPEVRTGNASVIDVVRNGFLMALFLTPIVSGLRSRESTATKDWLVPLGAATLFSMMLIAPFAWMEWSNNPLTQTGESQFPYPLFLALLLLPILVFLGTTPILRTLITGKSLMAYPFSLLLRVGFLSVLAMDWAFLIKKHIPMFLGRVSGL